MPVSVQTPNVYWLTMNQKYRAAPFLGSVLLLIAPYLGFVLYYSQRFPADHWPSWFTDTIAVWFITNFLLLMLLAKRIFRGQVVEPQRARRASTIAQIVVSYLLIVWGLLFLTHPAGVEQQGWQAPGHGCSSISAFQSLRISHPAPISEWNLLQCFRQG